MYILDNTGWGVNNQDFFIYSRSELILTNVIIQNFNSFKKNVLNFHENNVFISEIHSFVLCLDQ